MKTSGLLLACALLACALPLDASGLKAGADPGYRVLESVFGVHTLHDPDNDISIRLFETGGGDPAMNGDLLLLTLIPGDRTQAPLTWNTGIDIYSVVSAGLEPGRTRIVIEVREHFQDAAGAIGERPATYAIDYAVDRETGSVSDEVRTARLRPAQQAPAAPAGLD